MSRLPLISPLERALFLKAFPYFEELPPASIASLASHTEERSYAPGETVHEAGVRPREIVFLAEGAASLEYRDSAPVEIEAPGGLGLIAYFANTEPAPSTRALEPTLALVIPVQNFLQILEDDFVLFSTLARNGGRLVLDHSGPRVAEPGFPGPAMRETYAVLDLVQRLVMARQAPLFEGSNLTVVTELLRYQEPRVVEAGETLWREGDSVDSMALVLDGSFVSKGADGETVHPAGSMLGGWEIFSFDPRRETAEAAVASRIIEIDRALFSDVLEDHFDFAVDYLGKLCRRVVALRTPAAVPAETAGTPGW